MPPTGIVDSEIKDSLVGEGSTVTGATIDNCVIGIRSCVREGAYLKDVVMMGADFYEGEQRVRGDVHHDGNLPPIGIGRNCRIERCIIDKNARIGDNVTIKAHPDQTDVQEEGRWIVDGITIIPKGTVIAPGTEL